MLYKNLSKLSKLSFGINLVKFLIENKILLGRIGIPLGILPLKEVGLIFFHLFSAFSAQLVTYKKRCINCFNSTNVLFDLLNILLQIVYTTHI